MADRLAGAKRPVVEAQGIDDRRDCQGRAPVGRTQIGTEATPAELPLFAAVAQRAVDHEGDDLRAAVDGDDGVMGLAGCQQVPVAGPGALGAAVVERDAQRAVHLSS